MRIAVLISGSGSNLQAIIDAVASKQLGVEIAGVISNKEEAYGVQRAQQAGIATAVFAKKKIATFEALALQQIKEWNVDCVVLAGFMRVVSGDFIEQTGVPMINLHPSLLPKFKGLDTHQRALDAGEQFHGCSVHYVTAELDSGLVIAQNMLSINEDDTSDSLGQRVHSLEHTLLPQVLGWLANKQVAQKDNQLVFNGFTQTKPLCFFEL